MNRLLPTLVSANGKPSKHDPIASNLNELNSLWKQAEEELATQHVSVPIKIEIKTEYGGFYDAGSGPEPAWRDTIYLGWRKAAKDWRLCVGMLTDHLDGEKPTCEWKPIAECPKEYRIEMAKHYAKLRTKVEEVRDKLIPQLAAAVASLEQALGENPTQHAPTPTTLKRHALDVGTDTDYHRGITVAELDQQWPGGALRNAARHLLNGKITCSEAIKLPTVKRSDRSRDGHVASLLRDHPRAVLKTVAPNTILRKPRTQ